MVSDPLFSIMADWPGIDWLLSPGFAHEVMSNRKETERNMIENFVMRGSVIIRMIIVCTLRSWKGG